MGGLCRDGHNYLRSTESQLYCPPRYIDGEDGGGNFIGGAWREEPSPSGLEPLRSMGSNNYAMSASSIRDTFKDYFSSAAGEVSWQHQHVHHTS